MSTNGPVLVTESRQRSRMIEQVREKLRAQAIVINSGTLEQILDAYDVVQTRHRDE